MTRPLVVLRPEPGNAASAARIVAAGYPVIRLPLFAVRPLAWRSPGDARYDAVAFTSANAARHVGSALARWRHLPAYAVGRATAKAVQAEGFAVAAADAGDAQQLYATMRAAGVARALLIGGRDLAIVPEAPVVEHIAVYAAEPLSIAADAVAALAGGVALLHSARAARRLADLVADRDTIRIAAISERVRDAAGHGWKAVVVADRPDDTALIGAALTLAD